MDKNKCPKIKKPKYFMKNKGFLSPTYGVNFFEAFFRKTAFLPTFM